MAAIKVDDDLSPVVGGSPTTTVHAASAAASNGSTAYHATQAKSGDLGPDFFPNGINLDNCPVYNNVFGLVVPGRPVMLDFRCVGSWSEASSNFTCIFCHYVLQNDRSATIYQHNMLSSKYQSDFSVSESGAGASCGSGWYVSIWARILTAILWTLVRHSLCILELPTIQ